MLLLILAWAAAAQAQAPVPQWRVAPTPLLSLGGANAPENQQFVRITGTLRRLDGSVLVVESGSLGRGFVGARAFREDGVMLWETGGRGEGPGEFRAGIWWSRLEGDTLLLYDASQRRVTRLGPDGKVAGTEPVLHPERSGSPVNRFSNGDFLLRGGSSPQLSPGGWRDTVFYSVWSPGSTEVRRIAQNLADDLVGTSSSYSGLAFGRGVIYFLDRDRLYFGDGGEPVVSVVGQDGKQVPAIRWTQTRVRVSGADRERQIAARAAQRAAAGRPVERTPDGKVIGPPPPRFAEFFPAWSRLRVDADRNLWVERYPRPGEASTWMVFDLTGRTLASVVMPERFRLLEAGRDYVLGVWLDEDDVEHVRMFRLIKASG